MRDRPDGAELLRQARAVLLDDLAGALPEGRRYEVLMVASAMAMAARELEAGTAGRKAHRTALEALLGPSSEPDLEAALVDLGRRLAAEIRAGELDGDPRVHDVLARAAAARLALSNPKLLGRSGG
jgi:hypothetical protein